MYEKNNLIIQTAQDDRIMSMMVKRSFSAIGRGRSRSVPPTCAEQGRSTPFATLDALSIHGGVYEDVS
jgi:hypothetical protein